MSSYEARLHVLHVGIARSFEPLTHAARFEQDAWDARYKALEALNKAGELVIVTESVAYQALKEYKRHYETHKPKLLHLREANPKTLKEAYINKKKVNNIDTFLSRYRKKHIKLKHEAGQAKRAYELCETDYRNATDLHAISLAALKSLSDEYNNAVIGFSKLATHSRR